MQISGLKLICVMYLYLVTSLLQLYSISLQGSKTTHFYIKTSWQEVLCLGLFFFTAGLLAGCWGKRNPTID